MAPASYRGKLTQTVIWKLVLNAVKKPLGLRWALAYKIGSLQEFFILGSFLLLCNL